MIDRMAEVPTQDGKMETFIAQPSEHGPHPVAIVYRDIWGMREELYDTDTTHGYALPDRDVYNKRAAYTDGENIFAMFRRCL